MAVAIALGVLAGVLGFLPLIAGLRLTRRVTDTSNLGYAGSLLLGVLVSFVILFVAVALCAAFAREVILPFALAEVAVLILGTVGFGVYTFVKK